MTTARRVRLLELADHLCHKTCDPYISAKPLGHPLLVLRTPRPRHPPRRPLGQPRTVMAQPRDVDTRDGDGMTFYAGAEGVTPTAHDTEEEAEMAAKAIGSKGQVWEIRDEEQ